MADLKFNPADPVQAADFALGVMDVIYGCGQCLIAAKMFTPTQLAEVLDVIAKGGEAQHGVTARGICARLLSDAFRQPGWPDAPVLKVVPGGKDDGAG